MKRTTFRRATRTYWLAVPKGRDSDIQDTRAFPTRRLAAHFIDHRLEGWDGWRLVATVGYAEYRP